MLDLVLVQLPNPALSNPKMYTPLGILYLASVVKREGYTVSILDLRDGMKEIPQARFTGFSCTTPEFPLAKELSKNLTNTIIGGAHASLRPKDCQMFDYVVMGEGEKTILEILKGQEPGIINSSRVLDLDSIPYPDWDMVDEPFSRELFPGERYGKGYKAMTLIGSRGCPYACSFCGNIYRTPVVFRSVENITGELKELYSRGVTYFRFEDDCFTIHPDFERLCVELHKLKISFKCHTRSNLLTPDIAYQLDYAGCEECGLGVESADDTVLELNNKKERAIDHKRAIHILRMAGIRSKTYFISGLPGETERTLELNKEFIQNFRPNKWTLSTFTPYPGCDIFNDPDKYGVIIEDLDLTKWWNFKEKDGRLVHRLQDTSSEELYQRYIKLKKYFEGSI